MTRWFRESDGIVVEVIDFDPSGTFSAELTWTATEAVVEVGQEAPAPSLSTPRRLLLTPAEFRNSFSAFEEVAIVDFAAGADAEQDAQTKTIRRVVGVFFDRLKDPHLSTVDLSDPRNLAGLDLLVGAGILSPARRDAVASGLPS